MTYINPGKRDHVCNGKIEGKSEKLRKLRDVLGIVNGNEIIGFQNDNLSFQYRFEKKLSFLKLYNFFKN